MGIPYRAQSDTGGPIPAMDTQSSGQPSMLLIQQQFLLLSWCFQLCSISIHVFLYACFEKTDRIIVLPAAYGRAASSMLSAK